MRRLIMVTIFCLTSTPAFAVGCMLESDCTTGTTCVDGVCIRALGSGDGQDDNAPKKSETAKGCFDNSDCSQGICVKGQAQGECALGIDHLRRNAIPLPVDVHAHAEPLDGCAVETVVLPRRQVRVGRNEERIIAEIRL